VYGSSKLKGEEEALRIVNALVIRTSWLYSVHGRNFVKTIVAKAKISPELRVVFDQIGSPTWANDLAKAIVSIVEMGKESFKPGIFHYSNEGVCSWYDFAMEILSFYGINCKIIPILSCEYPVAANRPPYSVLNKNKIKETFSMAIPHWKDSLLKCLSTLNIETIL
jgi:dTDP-4-dehydrorhamnose reductase